MPLLALLIFVPATAGLACLLVRSRRMMSALGGLACLTTLALGIVLLHRVLERGVVTEWGEFFYADALSA